MNMPYMFVTLDVSRLSGWLNADAACRVTTELMEGDMRGSRGRAGGSSGRSVHGGSDWTLGPWYTRGGRTRKSLSMLVTLDVSKLSGWLNAVASCRVEREG